MSVIGTIAGRLAGLPPKRTAAVGVERDLPVPVGGGVTLLADRYFPRGAERPPIILMRTPYGRRTFGIFGRVFAERGYQVIIQSVRGTFGSGGHFYAFRHERPDGQATLTWLAAQPWFGGSVGTYGPSYLGLTQWALAAGAPAYMKAMALQIVASDRRAPMYEGGAFALDNALTWIHTISHQEEPVWRLQWEALRQRRALAPAFAHLPLREADRLAVGRTIDFYQDWLTHATPGEPYWTEMDFSQAVDAVTAPVSLLAGWYDFFLRKALEDYATLRRAGRQPYLLIGPWPHTSPGPIFAGLREGLAWFDTHLRGEAGRLRRQPVRIFVLGAKRWLDLPDWPPATTATRWYLQPERGLSPVMSAASEPDRYTYDPADPTPSVGGAVLSREGGPRDNRTLEARPDVLCYSSAPLERDLTVVGTAEAELYVRSSLAHTDFFARLCDVAPNGRSINICDGLVRLAPGSAPADADRVLRLRIALSPTACCFRAGHRVRLQVSSGAHPRFNRNLGSGEPLATGTRMVSAQQEVYHDPDHPSAVLLPVSAIAS